MAPTPPMIIVALGLVALLVALKRFLYRVKSVPLLYPPGPDSSDIPTHNFWLKYQEWGREYGDLVYIREKNLLIVNSLQTTQDLLDKRAQLNSDRPMSEMMKLCGAELVMSLERYSDQWRRNRRTFHQQFRPAAVAQFNPAQYKKVHHFLRDMTTTPEEFMQHVMALSQGVIFSAIYGLDLAPGDPLARKAVKAVETLGEAMTPGRFTAIERFPWLRFMPAWLPGCDFKRVADRCLRAIEDVHDIPLGMAMANLESGSGSSFIAELTKKNEGNPKILASVRATGTISYLAAADTASSTEEKCQTMSSISSFLLAMTVHPDIQAKGQDEIDHVVGEDRLPTLDDRMSLPYVQAIYREVMRLHPPLPLGLPHRLIENDIYKGFFIPKGCTITSNIWAINRDENLFEDPNSFRPERWLSGPEGPFASINDIYAFGFGRRVCAGRYMADETVWLTIVSVLATLSLAKAKDAQGGEIDIPEEFTETFFRHPKPYRSSITPRSKQALTLIQYTA